LAVIELTVLLPVARATIELALTVMVLPETALLKPAVIEADELETSASTGPPLFCRLEIAEGAVPLTTADRLTVLVAELAVACARTVLFEFDTVEFNTPPMPVPVPEETPPKVTELTVVLYAEIAPVLDWSFSTAYWAEAAGAELSVLPADPDGIE
jgi:hypothetical protein